MADPEVGERLEMLLVMKWLDEGADDEGALDVATSLTVSDPAPPPPTAAHDEPL